MSPNYSCRKIFNQEEEKSIEDYEVKYSQMNYGLIKVNVQRMVYELAIKNNKNIPDSWNKNKSAGRDWLYCFMKKHTNLSLRKPETCSLSRAISFNKHEVEEFFLKVKKVYSRNSSFADGSRLYNLDETATSTVQNPNNIITFEKSKTSGSSY